VGDKYTIVKRLPPCDLCPAGLDRPKAYADAKLENGPQKGQWAYVCKRHFKEHDCQLGLGHGQVLVRRD
jgi:hypothetical protein